MGGVPILVALAVVTVDYGYEPDGKGGVEYIVQVTPEEFEYAKKAGEISSVVDASVRGRVSRFVLRVGTGQLPRDAGPEPTPVAQAQAFEASPDRDPVPIPEIPDSRADGAAPPIAAVAMQNPTPVTSAKPIPQDSPAMSMPGAAAPPNDAMQDPLRRVRNPNTEAANPIRTASTMNSPPAPGAATPFPSTAAANPQTTAGPTTNLQTPGGTVAERDSQWDRERTASGTTPSTTPRNPLNPSPAAVGNFGAPPAGIEDPRLSTAAVGQSGYPQGHPSNYSTGVATNAPNNPATPATAPPAGNQVNGGQVNSGQVNSGQASSGQPGNGYGAAPGNYGSAAYTGSGSPASSYPANNYPPNGYPPNGYPPNAYPAGNYAGGQYVPVSSPGSPYSGSDPRGATGLLPERLADLRSPAASPDPAERETLGLGGAGDDESRGLTQQGFNLLLLLSLIANAYLIIQMSKLIQRYRDLRVNLRAATAGNSSPSPAAA